MKPLTIEELKALESGEYVYIISKEYNFEIYRRKSTFDNDNYFIDCNYCKELGYLYSDYGIKWLAYKNKEQAEAEEYKIDFDEHGGWEVSKYIPAHYQPWFTADTKEEAQQRIKELQGENK